MVTGANYGPTNWGRCQNAPGSAWTDYLSCIGCDLGYLQMENVTPFLIRTMRLSGKTQDKQAFV